MLQSYDCFSSGVSFSLVPDSFRLWDYWLARYSQGKALALIQREQVVSVRVDNGPDDDNPKERNEAGPVVHYRSERKHYRCPIDNIVDKEEESPGTSQPARLRAAHGFPLPDRPPGRMPFDNPSVDRPDNRQPDEARKV